VLGSSLAFAVRRRLVYYIIDTWSSKTQSIDPRLLPTSGSMQKLMCWFTTRRQGLFGRMTPGSRLRQSPAMGLGRGCCWCQDARGCPKVIVHLDLDSTMSKVKHLTQPAELLSMCLCQVWQIAWQTNSTYGPSLHRLQRQQPFSHYPVIGEGE
jgi:hypothetical protein